MTPEALFIKDKALYFLNQTIFNPVNAQKLAPSPEIAQTLAAKQEKEEALTKTMQQIKDFNFTPTEVNSLLGNMLNGFARESRGWNQYATKAALEILPFIGLKKITPAQIAQTYIEAVVTILPIHTEVTADRGFEALIEAGMILIPHLSAISRKTTNTQTLPVLRQELKNRRPYTNNKTYKDLVGKIDNLDNRLKTGLIKPIDISPKDTTEITNRFREFGKGLFWKHLSPEQFATLDSLVKEAIRDFGMNAIQIIEMSGMTEKRINQSMRRLKANGSIPDRNIHEGSLTLQVQELLGRGIEMTAPQIAHALGPGITKSIVYHAKRRLTEERQHKEKNNNSSQEPTSLEQNITNLRRQGFSRYQIADQLDMPIERVLGLINKLTREEKIERQIDHHRRLNDPITERVIKIDAYVDEMQSNNPGITWKEIANRLRSSIHRIRDSLKRLKVYRQIEQLIAQEKTVLQIAQEMGVGEAEVKLDIAKLQKLRDFQSISKTNKF